MNKFYVKIILFCLIFILLSNIIGYIGDKLAPENIWRERSNQQYQELLENKDDILAISIGSSHSESIDFENLNIKGQILARPSADLFETEKYVDNVLSKLPKLNTIFICISYFSFNWDNSLSDDRKILRIEFYSMLPSWTPIEGDFKNFLLGKFHKISRIMSVVRHDNWKNVINKSRFMISNTDLKNEQTSQLNKNLNDCRHLDTIQLSQTSKKVAGSQSKIAIQMTHRVQDIQTKASEALERTIIDLKRKNIRVILYTPPYYYKYSDEFKKYTGDLLESAKQNIYFLERKYDIKYYDYSCDKDFNMRNDIFLNSDHLNDCGRREFTDKFFSELRKNYHLSLYD